MKSEPSEYLLPESLPNIYQNILMFSLAAKVINQERCIAPTKNHKQQSLKRATTPLICRITFLN